MARKCFTSLPDDGGRCLVQGLIPPGLEFSDHAELAVRLNKAVLLYDSIQALDTDRFEDIATKGKELKELRLLKRRLKRGWINKAINGTKNQAGSPESLKAKHSHLFKVLESGDVETALQELCRKIEDVESRAVSKAFSDREKAFVKSVEDVYSEMLGKEPGVTSHNSDAGDYFGEFINFLFACWHGAGLRKITKGALAQRWKRTKR